jgi:hypothetical protein
MDSEFFEMGSRAHAKDLLDVGEAAIYSFVLWRSPPTGHATQCNV